MNFDIVIDTALATVGAAEEGRSSPIDERKRILAFANDFEDKQWRHGHFNQFIWNNISETALSARERASLADSAFTSLQRSAMNLRLTDAETDPGRGSEIAEIAMYAVMKHHFHALPVVPKIFYKQNKNDYAKGADSVHIVIASSGDDFTLWFGESKFYKDIKDARLDKVVESVSEMLATDKIKKENSIVVGLTDLNELITNDTLRQKLRAALDASRSIDKLKPILHVPILLLHECPLTASATDYDDVYISNLKAQVSDRAAEYFKRQAAKLGHLAGYDKINFHLIVFPVPNKATIVNSFIATANALKGRVA
jgi:hypothetical protein